MAELTITATDVVAASTAATGNGTAGDTITAGMPLYKDSGDSNKLKPAQSTTAAAAACVGIALHGATSGQPIQYITSGSLTLGNILTVGTCLVVSGTAGKLELTTDIASTEFVTTIGPPTSVSAVTVNITATGSQKA